MISATLVDTNTYEVVIDRPEETRHRVRLSQEYYKKLTGGTITHEWLIVQAFNFLLEREPSSAILREFDLEDINAYFPDFEAAMAQRLGGPAPTAR